MESLEQVQPSSINNQTDETMETKTEVLSEKQNVSESVQPCQFQKLHKDIDDRLVPKIGMIFETDEKAYQFYCVYGKKIGFGVRKHLVKRRASGLVYSRVFSCYKEGFCRKIKPVKKPRLDDRTGCRAQMTVRINDDGRFYVSEFEPNHNHDLVVSSSDVLIYPIHGSKQRVIGNKLVSGQPRSNDNDRDGRSEPVVGMEFDNDEAAYQFYINYASTTGFSVRKHLVKRRVSGVIYSRTYCCHKEGHSRKNNDDQKNGHQKSYARTGCLAFMTIKIMKNGKFRITDFEATHNHSLVMPSNTYLLKWQWQRGLVNSNDALTRLDDRIATTSKSLVMEKIDGHINYLPSMSSKSMKVCDIGALMQYLQAKQTEDPSFYYALQLGKDDRVVNIFWSDGKSMVDYDCFGDVICFDTTYATSDNSRPFALFLGVNHHKQIIIFGSAFMYDVSEASFKWVFETFKTIMHGKQPRVVFSNQTTVIANAVVAAWPTTVQRFCVRHVYHNSAKHLNSVFKGSTTFAKDFARCLYDLEEEDRFKSEWEAMLKTYGLKNNLWLDKLYADRQNWCLAYRREIFSADICSSLASDDMNKQLIESLNVELDLLSFLKQYDRIVDERRFAETQAEKDSRQNYLELPASRMLRQAANTYTPAIFKTFRREFELSIDCMVYNNGQFGTTFEMKVNDEENPKEYAVKYDSSDCTVLCSCRKFEFVGIQCLHVLKVLDIVNIKELPPRYILKRWTKDAKVRNLKAYSELGDTDGGSSLAKRYNCLFSVFNKIAEKAAESEESYAFLESISDHLTDQVDQIIRSRLPEKY